MGQPSGPGGSLGRFFMSVLVRKKIKPERKKAMRKKVDEEEKEAIEMWDVEKGSSIMVRR